MGTDLLGEKDKTYATQAFISKKVKDVDRELKNELTKGGYGEEIDEEYLTKEYFDKNIGESYKLNSEILNEVKKLRGETTPRLNSIDSTNKEMIRLQTELNDLQSKIVKFQTEIPKIYYVGAIFGAAGTAFGIFTANLIYLSVGLGVAITAIIGLLEAKINARRGIV
jgi:hypothetical protein